MRDKGGGGWGGAKRRKRARKGVRKGARRTTSPKGLRRTGKKVHGHGGKLPSAAALHKEHLVVARDVAGSAMAGGQRVSAMRGAARDGGVSSALGWAAWCVGGAAATYSSSRSVVSVSLRMPIKSALRWLISAKARQKRLEGGQASSGKGRRCGRQRFRCAGTHAQ